MSRCSLLLVLLLLATSSASAAVVVLGAAEEVAPVEYGPAGGNSERAVGVANGDRMLVVWNRGEGAVRLDDEGRPLDVPPIRLPKPQWTSGADVVAARDGWIVGWTAFPINGSPSMLRLVRVTREGGVEDLRDVVLQREVPQNAQTHLAIRNGVIVAAFESRDDGPHVEIVTESASHTIAGYVFELAATSDGFALLQQDRIVWLTADGAPAGEVALPAGFYGSAIAAAGRDLLVAGLASGAVEVLRVSASSAEVLASVPEVKASLPRFALNGAEMLLVWNSTATIAGPYGYSSWDLYATRIRPDGVFDAPQKLRPSVDLSGRWLPGIDYPLAQRMGDRWIVVWSEGPRTPGYGWRNLYSATFSSSLAAVSDATLISYRASDQFLAGTAMFGDVLLTLWSEYERVNYEMKRHVYAARRGLDGRRIDAVPLDIGAFEPRLVRATDTGFLVSGENVRVQMGIEGPPVIESKGPLFRDLACANDTCLAAWIDGSSIVFAEWRNGDLVTAPIAVHTTARAYEDVALSSDGESFLLAFTREGTPGGTILTSAHIRRTSDGWTQRVSDFAASPGSLHNLRLVRQAARYLAVWGTNDQGQFASQLTFDGHSMDGEETGWSGWSIPPSLDLEFDGTRTILLSGDGPACKLYELRGRTAVMIGQIDADIAFVECSRAGRCALVYQNEVTGDPWFQAYRLFTQPFAFARPRTVRH